MKPHAKALADLAAAIFVLQAKVDAMFPEFLEPKQGRPSVERAVDALQVEVGDPRAHTTTSHGDIHGASHAVPDDAASSASVEEVPAITGSEPKPDIPIEIAEVSAVPPLHGGVFGLAAESVAFHCSPSTTNTCKEALDMVQSVCTGSFTAAPTTCSMFCPPRHPVAAQVLAQSSPLTPTEYGLDTNNIHVALLQWCPRP
jgi:hypothetical protein